MTWTHGAGLEGKAVVVTGAAGGIGREVAAAFADAGAHVCGVDLSSSPWRAVVDALAGGPHRAEALDVRDLAEHEPLLRRAQEAFGRLDVLANTAAVLIRRDNVDEVTEEDWDTAARRQPEGRVLPQPRGRRVCSASRAPAAGSSTSPPRAGGAAASAVRSPTPRPRAGSCRCRAGSPGLTPADGITVNTVAPGAVDTPMMRSGLTEDQLQAQVDQIPMGYMAEPPTLPGSWSSSLPTTRATSPARRSTSAAAG